MTVPVSAETDVVLSMGEREKEEEDKKVDIKYTKKQSKDCYYHKPHLIWWNKGEKNVSQKLIKVACKIE